MKVYQFTIYINGIGKDETEAFEDAIEGFFLDPGEVPETDCIRELEDIGD